MSLTFSDKDLLVVGSVISNLSDGVFVFLADDELYVKRLQKTPAGITAISDNTLYRDFPLEKDVNIVAKVVSVFKNEKI